MYVIADRSHMEYEKLCRLVEQWNFNRVRFLIFHLNFYIYTYMLSARSLPSFTTYGGTCTFVKSQDFFLFQDLEVEGVMRFYFCDDEGRVCTKCIRVSSTATTQVIHTFIPFKTNIIQGCD